MNFKEIEIIKLQLTAMDNFIATQYKGGRKIDKDTWRKYDSLNKSYFIMTGDYI